MARLQRRQLLLGAAGLAAPAILRAQGANARVVVVGGGFGGATVARYLRAWAPQVQVTLVEPARRFATCPFSNHYLAGLRGCDSIVHGYGGLRAAGVHVIHAQADDVDADAVFTAVDVKDIYQLPLNLYNEGVDQKIAILLRLPHEGQVAPAKLDDARAAVDAVAEASAEKG